jgi:hypothetical protein
MNETTGGRVSKLALPKFNNYNKIMLLPCKETYERMVGSHTGIWPELVNDDSIEFAIKLTTDLMKAVLKGAPVTLVTTSIHTSSRTFRIVGLRIEDDKNDPIFIHHPQEIAREQKLFLAILEKESALVTFFDELVRPVVVGKVSWDKEHANIAAANLNRTLPHYQGNSRTLLIEAMDLAEVSISKWHQGDGSSEAQSWKAIPLQFENLNPVEVSSIETGTFTVNDPDEGGGLEKSAYLLLEANYPGTAHLNPQFNDGPNKREFCDVLVVGASELLIIQSKVMAMLERNPAQPTARRVSNVFSNFQKAIAQLGGSVRMLRQGKTIYTKQGSEICINLDAVKTIHGIALLSTTNLSLPWPKVAKELIAASRKAQAKFHAIDFIELQQHVVFGKTLNEVSLYLDGRFEIVERSGNANVKTRFLDEENQPVTSKPIDDDKAGYVFTLEVERNGKVDAAHILKAFLKVLKGKRFTGRCEYFQNAGFIEGEKFCWISLGLRWSGGTETYPSYDWWLSFAEEIRPDLEADSRLNLSSLSEMATLGEIRANHPLALIMELVDGKTIGFLDPDKPTTDE